MLLSRKSVTITKLADNGSHSTGLIWMQPKMGWTRVHDYYLGFKGQKFGARDNSGHLFTIGV